MNIFSMKNIKILALLVSAFFLLNFNHQASEVFAQNSKKPFSIKDNFLKLDSSKGQLFQISTEKSKIRFYVYRAGFLASLGHNHVISTPKFEAFCFLGNLLEDSQCTLGLKLEDLEIDNPQHRQIAGADFSSQPSKDDINGTREHMLGADNLQADQFPHLIIKTGSITGKTPEINASIIIELHGQTFTYPIKAQLTKNIDELQLKGSFSIKQSDFGIKPFSALGGVLAVQDEIKITFDLIAYKVNS